MNEFYVDPYVDEDAPTARQSSRSQQKPPTRIIRAPAYSPSSNSPSSVGNRNQEVSPVSSSPSPRASRTRAETTRNQNSRDSRPAASSSSSAAPVHARETPQPSTPFTSPPRRPPSAMSPRATDAFSNPQSPRFANSAKSPRLSPTGRSTDDGGSAPRASSSGAYGHDGAAATNGSSSPPKHAVPPVPRTRGPGSRMLVPGTRQFDHHRRNSIHITNALSAAAAAENEDGSAASGATVPSLFTTMHSRRKARADGPGSSITMLSKTATRTRPSSGTSPQGDGVSTENESAIETLELPMQHYVAQSAYTMKNPFRTQDFAAFAANPSYMAPPDVAAYSDVPMCDGGGGLFAQQRASEGSFLIHRLADLTLPSNQADRERLYAYLGRTLEVLQTGEWFLKWTRDNSVKQRFVWLNLQRGTLMWSSTAKQSLFDNSELKLSTVTDIRPDCIQDEQTGRVFYRMQIRTPDHWKTFATEIREKFDMWFQALVEVTRPNLTNGLPGVWGRPSEMVNTNGRGVPGRWTSRYSLLSAIAEGANETLQMSGAPMETRTSSGD